MHEACRWFGRDATLRQPRNGDEEVSAFAELCALDLDAHVVLAPNASATGQANAAETAAEPVCGWGVVTVRQVLTTHLDFMATPRRRFFQLLSFFCSGIHLGGKARLRRHAVSSALPLFPVASR